jgi:hypothetical protein
VVLFILISCLRWDYHETGYVSKASSAIQTDDGGYISVGCLIMNDRITNGCVISFDFDSSLYIVKYDKDGNIDWYTLAGKDNYTSSSKILQTADNSIYIAGGVSYQYEGSDEEVHEESFGTYLIKISPTGYLEWETSYISTGKIKDVVETPDNGLITVGYGSVLKINPDGNVEWDKYYQPDYEYNNHVYLYAITETLDGNYIAVGSIGNQSFWDKEVNFYSVKFDINGNILWEKDYAENSYSSYDINPNITGDLVEIYQNNYGTIISLGIDYNNDSLLYCNLNEEGDILNQNSLNAGYYNMNLLKSFSGNEISLLINYNGNVKAEGFYLLKFDMDAKLISEHLTNLNQNIHINQVNPVSDNGYIIAGSKEGEYYILKTDANFNKEWDYYYDYEGTYPTD